MGKTNKSNFEKWPKSSMNKGRKKFNSFGREVIKKDKTTKAEESDHKFEEYDDGSNFEKLSRKR